MNFFTVLSFRSSHTCTVSKPARFVRVIKVERRLSVTNLSSENNLQKSASTEMEDWKSLVAGPL